MSTQRPTVTPEMIQQAAQRLAAENGWNGDEAKEIASVYRRHMNGYSLAKELDSRYCWDISVLDVESLDCMDSYVRSIHDAACMAWAKEQNIQPPLPIGTMTTRGEITGIYEHGAACYLIRENETDDSRRLIVRFEDARAKEAV
jgi:hypothetical protein